MDKKVFKVQTGKVNEVTKYLKKKNITETNNLFRAACVKVAVCIGLKKSENRKKNEPRWKIRIDEDIKRLKQNSNFWKENPKENWE